MQPVRPLRRKNLLPNIDVVKDRHDHERVRYYYRVAKGPRVPLVGIPYNAEFMHSYRVAQSGPTGVAGPVVQRRPEGLRCRR